MPWNITFSAEFGIVCCTYTGQVTAEEFKEGSKQAIASAIRHNTNLLLIDDSKLEPAVTITEIYEMPQFYDAVKGNRRSKIALILPPTGKIREDVRFYETVCRNRGWSVKAFDERPEAIDWLRQ